MNKHFAFVTMVGLAASHGSVAAAQECPAALPVPADKWMVECKANIVRCGAPMPIDECDAENRWALAEGLITPAAFEWLQGNLQCVVVRRDGGIGAICLAGCFEQQTQITTIDAADARGETSVHALSKGDFVASLSAGASLSEPVLERRAIRDVVSGPEPIDMYEFKLSNGRQLRVTRHHGMVLEDGHVVEAQNVEVGDLFLDPKGKPVEVRSVAPFRTSESVYNLRVDADAPQEHVIVAEGVLIGDLAWQNELARERESIRLRN